MLHFTSKGVVATPTTVQLRVTTRYPGRVPAGAPVPTRELSDEEVLANIRHFTLGLRGPRTSPCRALVLAGVELAARPAVADAVRAGRGWGLERVTLHLGRGHRDALATSPLGREVDAVALTVVDDVDVSDVAALRARPGRPGAERPHVTAVVLLDEPTLGRLVSLARGLAAARPDRVVFTWPFPPAEDPPHAERLPGALAAPIAALDAASVACGVKGVPACRLGALGDRLWRSANRWYVDADHQAGAALLFFPDVVRFAKDDACRFCAADARCDGAPEAWLRRGLAGALRPLETVTSPRSTPT